MRREREREREREIKRERDRDRVKFAKREREREIEIEIEIESSLRADLPGLILPPNLPDPEGGEHPLSHGLDPELCARCSYREGDQGWCHSEFNVRKFQLHPTSDFLIVFVRKLLLKWQSPCGL